LYGLGLLEAVPGEAIAARADFADVDHDGISGRVNRRPDGRVGRFGRKAFIPSLAELGSGGLAAELGMTPRGPALSGAALASVLEYVRFLAPSPSLPLTWDGEHGRQLFRTMGCLSCHTPAMVTGVSHVRAFDRK